jgi:hypothetical protein
LGHKRRQGLRGLEREKRIGRRDQRYVVVEALLEKEYRERERVCLGKTVRLEGRVNTAERRTNYVDVVKSTWRCRGTFSSVPFHHQMHTNNNNFSVPCLRT